MKTVCSALVLLACASVGVAAEIPAKPIAAKGKVLVSDDFERTGLGDWKAVIPTFFVTNGVLVGRQTRDNHGSVGAVKAAFKDGVIEFKFRLEGSTGFNAVCDDKAVGYLKSPGLAHPTKSDFHFTVSGKDAHFDEVRIYAAEPVSPGR
jgi:hypothetical protein